MPILCSVGARTHKHAHAHAHTRTNTHNYTHTQAYTHAHMHIRTRTRAKFYARACIYHCTHTSHVLAGGRQTSHRRQRQPAQCRVQGISKQIRHININYVCVRGLFRARQIPNLNQIILYRRQTTPPTGPFLQFGEQLHPPPVYSHLITLVPSLYMPTQ